jgi:hypothetical protein
MRICWRVSLRAAAPLSWRPVSTMTERTSPDRIELPLEVLDRIDRICDRSPPPNDVARVRLRVQSLA